MTVYDYSDSVLELHVSLFSWRETGSGQLRSNHMALFCVRAAAQRRVLTSQRKANTFP